MLPTRVYPILAQAPLAQYAETLGEQARQRRTLRLAENMAAGRRSRSGKREDADNTPSDEDDMEGPSTVLLLPQPHSRQPAQRRPAKKRASYSEVPHIPRCPCETGRPTSCCHCLGHCYRHKNNTTLVLHLKVAQSNCASWLAGRRQHLQ